MPQIPITAGFYKSRSLPVSHQECINLYAKKVEQGGLSDEILVGTPGIRSILSTGDSSEYNRGSHVMAGICYFVNGWTLYSLDRTVAADGSESFSTTSLGTIPEPVITEKTRVEMEDNGSQLMILIPGYKGYIYDPAGVPTFQEITSGGFTANGTPQHVVFVDGYFACSTDSKKWIISNLRDGLTWGALDFSSAESDPDTIVTLAKVKNTVYVLGSETTEGYQNIGGAGFPFQRNNVFIAGGCLAPLSVVYIRDNFYMIGAGVDEGPSILQFSGTEYQKRSTDAIDALLEALTPEELENVFGFSYGQDGSYFVGWTLPDTTIVLELSLMRWSERKSDFLGSLKQWRVSSIASAYNRKVVFDVFDGGIGELDLDFYYDYDTEIRSLFTLNPLANDGSPVVVPNLELTMESGVGNSDIEDPQVSLVMSRDGKKWEYERQRSVGKKGEYNKRLIWRRNGRFDRFVVCRFLMSGPFKKVIIKLEAI